MVHFAATPVRLRSCFLTFVLAVSAAGAPVLAPLAQAETKGSGNQTGAAVIQVEVPAGATKAVVLLHELAVIESDVRLAMMFAVDHISDPTGSHASDPFTKIWPKAGADLIAAGVEDLGPLLQQLAEAADEKTVLALGGEVLKGVVRARSVLKPTYDDMGASVLELTREAMDTLDPSGTTAVADYQDAWSLVNVARTEVDLLMRATDPVKAKAAVKMVLALDDVLLSMPDPAATGPVAFDPAVIAAAIATLEPLVQPAV